ncbi:DUF3599 family protein [Faecalibacterium gallinarum]|uniref:Phage-like element PBSX protein XkdH n=1 Tax=Faecalibacterium gallinarum TaxID=2903556 RepID=A0AA37MYE1_9FIRM|nr:DUF3599 family protein [Faecalibacterium gallinarum]GJN64891.1 phage-like element PBSX protein XkdH [Faecalibacterium gallinarum]
MAIEDLFNHRCSIYHLREETTSPGWGLPGQTEYSYPDTPDLSGVPCHFNVGASTELAQESPFTTYLYTGKLNLPAGTDVRINDKIVNEASGLDFTAQEPQDIRGHHVTVTIQRKGSLNNTAL